MNSYKLIVLCLFLTMVVTACANVTTPTPISSFTATSVSTPTLIPITPTVAAPTVEPTPTVDPNMPKDATGKDAQGNWTKDNGTSTWRDIHLNNTPEGTISGWFTSHILDGTLDGGIPLARDDVAKDSVPFYFDFQEGVSGPYLRHPQQVYGPNIPAFEYFVMGDIIQQYFQQSEDKIPREEGPPFYEKWSSKDGIFLPVTTRTGSFDVKLGQDHGYIFHAIPWDEADPAVHPEFNETQDDLAGKSVLYRWTLTADANDNLVCIGAVKDPSKLTVDQFYTWILNPLYKVVSDWNAPVEWRLAKTNHHWFTSGTAYIYFVQGRQGAAPEFTIEQSP